MSKVVENQIVQMQFDNKEFEKNVNASMKSLDTFKGKMDFSDSSKSFEELEKTSKAINFDKLNAAIDGVGDHFSLLGRTVYKVTDQIADYFASKITGAISTVKKMSTDIIDVKAGYSKYDEYVNGVKTILYALGDDQKASLVDTFGSEIEGVEEKLSELMWYTDETSYNFTDMVSTIGKFLGAGLNLDDAIKDMQGIANWAALSGQNATIASQAMYQLSQALGRGNLQYMDWQQAASLKNMGTTAAKDVFIESARKQGYIKDEDIAEAKRVKGEDRDQWRNYFFESDALNDQKWFKTSVLEAGLQEFSKASDLTHKITTEFEDTNVAATDVIRQLEYMTGKGVKTAKTARQAAIALLGEGSSEDDILKMAGYLETLASDEYKLGREAFAAAQKAYTFSDALNATKDAVTTKWAGIFTKLIGNAEEASVLWTDFANSLWDIFAGPLDNLYQGLSKWSKLTVTSIDDNGEEIEISVRQHLWEGVGETFSALGEVISEVGKAIKSVFHYIRTGSEDMEELSDEERNNKIVNFFENVRKGIHNVAESIKNFVHSEFFRALLDFIKSFGKIIRPVINGIKEIAKAILKGFGGNASKSVTNILKALTSLNEVIGQLIEDFIGSNGFKTALKIITKYFEITSGAVKELTKFFLDLFSGSKDLDEAFKDLGKSANKGLDGIRDFVYEVTGIDLSWPINQLKKFVTFLTTDFISLLKGAGLAMKTLWGNINSEVFAKTPEAWNEMCDKMENGTPGERIKAVLEFLGGRIHDGIDAIIKTVEELTGADLSKFTEKLSGFFDGLADMLEQFSPGIDAGWEAVKSIVKDIGKIFADVVDVIFTVIGQITGIENMGPDKVLDLVFWILEKLGAILIWIVQSLGAVIVAAGPYLEACGDMIANGFGQVAKAFNYLIGVDKSPEALKALENVKSALKVIIGILIFLEAYKFYKRIKWFLESSANLADTLTGKITRQTTLQQITGLIKGIASVMIAIAILANQDIGGIAMACVSLGIVVQIMLRSLKIIMEQMQNFAKYVSKSKLTDKELATIMTKVNAMIKAIGGLATKIAVATIIMAVADKIGGPLMIERSMIALATTIIVMTKGLQWILTSLNNSKVKPATIKQARKALNTLTGELRKITIDVALLGWIVSAAFSKDQELSMAMSMAFLVGMVLALGVATAMIARAAKGYIGDGLSDAAKIISKVGLTMIEITGALWILMEVMDRAALKGKMGETFLIGLAIIASVLLLLYVGINIISALTKIGEKASKSADTNLQKFAKSIAKNVASMAKISSGVGVLVLSAMAVIGSIAALSALAYFLGSYILTGIVLTAVIFLAMYGLIKLLGNLKIEAEVPKVLAFAAVMGVFVGSIFTLTAALALLTLVSASPNFWPAVAALAVMAGALLGICALAPVLAKASADFGQVGLAMIGLATSLLIMAVALNIIAEVDWEAIGKAAVMLGAFVLALAGLAFIATIMPALTAVLASISGIFMGIGLTVIGISLLVGILMYLSDNVQAVTDKINELANNVGPLLDAIVKLVIALIQGLADAIGNNAEALAGSLLDAIGAILLLVWNLIKALWTRLTQALNPMNWADEVLEAFADIWEVIAGGPAKLLEIMMDFGRNIKNGVARAIWDAFTWLVTMFWTLPGLVLQAFANLLKAIMDFFGIASPSKVFLDIGVNLIKGLVNGVLSMGEFLIDSVIGVFQWLLDRIVDALSFLYELGSTVINWFWEGICLVKDNIFDMITGAFSFLYDSIMKIFEPILNFGKEIIEFFWDGIQIAFKIVKGLITGKFDEVWEGIKEALGFIGGAPKRIFEIGKNLINGLIDGIADVAKNAVKKVKEFGESVLGGLKSVLGIHSPSTETFGMAINFIKGLVNGIASGGGSAINAVKSLGSELLGNFLPPDGLASALNMGGLMDQFKQYTTGNYDFNTGLNANYAGQVDMTPYMNTYAFEDQINGLDHVYAMDVQLGSASQFFEPQEASFNTTQLADITGSYESGTDKTVDAIHELQDAVIAQGEDIKNLKIVLNTGDLVGGIVDEMDQELGRRSQRKGRA